MEKNDLQFIIQLQTVHNKIYKFINKHLRIHKLTFSEYAIMETIYYNGPQKVQEIASQILVTSGTMTYMISKLLRKGFVNRRQDEKDKRVFWIELTEGGKNLMDHFTPHHNEYIEGIFVNVSEEEKQFLTRLLFKLNANLSVPDDEHFDH
jgi:MarR family 2-MHQ and catechol resistance regulon transcriptional repressor